MKACAILSRMGCLGVRVVCLFLITATFCNAQPWDTAFAPDTAAISREANALPVADDPPAVILLEEYQYTIDRQSRIASRVRIVYLVRSREAVESWSAVQQEYQPWFESRPEIRARVISPGGRVSTLDPSTIADAPASQFDATIFSDRRVVRAPLPGLEPGALVEQEIVTRESRTQLDGGAIRRVFVTPHVPVQRFRLSIDAHRQIPLRATTYRIPPEALQNSTSRKGTSIRLELGPLMAEDDYEYNAPPDQSRQKYVTFSTGEDWQALAEAYSKVVEEKITGADLASFLEGLDLSGPPLEVAAAISAKLHSRIRYTGVEFAEAEIIPGTPAQTLGRGYGDCKDKSTLLTALLREAGLDAHVALLSASFDSDIDPGLPGLGLFNHAIVHVAAETPFWIDATAANARVGVLPAAAEGRLALIAKPDTAGLIATPLSSSQDNWRRRSTTVRMSQFGRGSLHEVTQAGGSLETGLRSEFGDASAAEKATKENVEENLQGTLRGYRTTARDDFSSSFEVTVEIDGTAAVATGMEDAAVGINRADVFQDLPFSLTFDSLAGGEKERESDIWFTHPHRNELRYRIYPPVFFKAVSLPESKQLHLGPASYSENFQTLDDGTIEIVFTLDSGKRRWSPQELKAFQETAKPFRTADPLAIRLIPRSSELAALGEVHTAVKEVREYLEDHPEDAATRARLSRLLITAGLGDTAIQQARRATEIDPDSAAAWMALGLALQHDTFGRRLRPGYSIDDSVAAMRKASELGPDLWFVSAELAFLLEHDNRGVRYSPRANLDEAIQIHKDLMEQQPALDLRPSLVTALFRSGRRSEANEQLQHVGPALRVQLEPLMKAFETGATGLIIDAQAQFPDSGTRARYLWNVSYALMQMRRYDLAVPIFQASARISSLPGTDQFMKILSGIRRHEDASPPKDDPRSPVWEVLTTLLTDSGEPNELRGLYTARDDWSAWERELSDIHTRLGRAKAQARKYGFEEDTLVDVILSTTNLSVDGEEARGFRIRGDAQPTFIVVREESGYRILGSAYNMAEIGKLVWRLLDDGDLEAARSWLDRAIPEIHRESVRTPPAVLLWSGVTDDLRGPTEARAAAAALVGRTEPSDKAIGILRETLERASVTIDKKQASVALAEALETAGQWDALAEIARSLGSSGLFSSESFEYFLKAAQANGDWQELARWAQQRLDEQPDHREALRALAEASAHQQDLAILNKATNQLLENEFVSTGELMLDAWLHRLVGRVDADRLIALQQKVSSYKEPGTDFYYTQAMMEAELNQPDEALQSLRAALGDLDARQAGPKTWFVQALICDLFGFPDAADSTRQRARLAPVKDDLDRWALAALDAAAL